MSKSVTTYEITNHTELRGLVNTEEGQDITQEDLGDLENLNNRYWMESDSRVCNILHLGIDNNNVYFKLGAYLLEKL